MEIFHWEDLDHGLLSPKLLDLAEDMHALVKADERRIQFENRGNANADIVPSLVLQMKQNRADEWAPKTYEIYCEVWKTQGHAKSAAFLRAVSSLVIVPLLRARARAIATEFLMFGVRTVPGHDSGRSPARASQNNTIEQSAGPYTVNVVANSGNIQLSSQITVTMQ